MQVYLLANLEHNPYLNNLVCQLRAKNIQVKGGEYNYQGIFFLPKVLQAGEINIFHLHDLHYFLQGKHEPIHSLFDNDILRRNLKFLIFCVQILILKIIGIRIVWTVHEWHDKYSHGRQAIFKCWGWIFRFLFDSFIVHSHSLEIEINRFLNLGKTSKVTVIYHGNYIDAYPNQTTVQQARQILSIPKYKFVFLLFGNIYPSKGFGEAIQAFKQLDIDDTFLLIAGKPANQQISDRILQLSQNCDNIRYIPQIIPDGEIQNYMQASNCVILPYQVFTTSGVALLAMSFGKPCIAPDSGYFSEVFDRNGAFLFDLSQPYGLATAMYQAVKNCSSLSQMGAYNFQRAQKWDWEYVANETYQIYTRCFLNQTIPTLQPKAPNPLNSQP